MRKQTKLALGLSAAALLAVGASMTSFAARGWVAEGDQWYYYDNNGDYVTDKWKSYNGNYFYLGSDGYMLTNELIEDSNNWYYVDANGAMVKNTWVAVPADETEEQDVDYRWYYFGSNGKAFKSSFKKTINGKKYGFDDEGKMLFGFVNDSYEILNDGDDPVLYCDRYYGSNDDGAMHTGWLLYQDAIDGVEGYEDQFYWFWFNSKGEKFCDKGKGNTKKINGRHYAFDTFGAMLYEWVDEASIANTSTTGWFSAAEDGHLAKSTWIWAVPSEAQNADDHEDDTSRWFYAEKHGKLLKARTKKINGKWYCFDDAGIMQYGLVTMDVKSVKDANNDAGHVIVGNDPDDVDSTWVYAQENLYFFSADEEKDGSMKTGTNIKIAIDDDTYTFGFDKTTGLALDGLQKNRKLYRNGILQTASDNKYEKSFDGNYLISSSGTAMKGSLTRTYKDDDGYFWGVATDADNTVVGPMEEADQVKAELKKLAPEK